MPLDRAALASAPRELLSRGSRFKPAVHRIDDATQAWVVKDVREVPAWSRPLARWLMRREWKVLEALAGVPGVPVLGPQIDRDAFAMELLPGAPLHAQAFEAAPDALAADLRRIVDAMHARGVFHLDLRQRQNLLVDGETLYVVDFGAAWRPRGPVRWLLGGIFGWIDRQAVLKYVARHAPDRLTRDEARAVLRYLRFRRWWIFSPHGDGGERAAAQARLARDDEHEASS